MCNDGTMPAHSAFKRWEAIGTEFTELTGRDQFDTEMIKQRLSSAGFVDIVEQSEKVPVGAWSKDERYREIGKVNFA